MAKVLVLFCSAYGHTEKMAQAVAEGVREAGAAAIVKPGPELVPEEVARKAGYKLGPSRADRSGRGTPEYGAIIFGTGDAVWQHDRADEKSSGPNGRPVSF